MLTPRDVSFQLARALKNSRGCSFEYILIPAGYPDDRHPLDDGEDFVSRKSLLKSAKPGDKVDVYCHYQGCLSHNVVVTITDERAPAPKPRVKRDPAERIVRNRYCGPFALGYVLGIGPDGAAKLFREISGRRAIKGVYNSEMQALLNRECEIEGEWAYNTKASQPTLAAWLKQHPRGLYVVNVTRHYVVVDGSKIHDNNRPEGLPAKQWPKRRARVRRVWKLQRA